MTTDVPDRLRRSLAVVAIAGLLLAGCSRTGADEPTRSAGQQGYTTGTGRVTVIEPANRKALPVVSGPALGADQTVSTADYAGKVIVLNIWGSWCPPCRAEAPALQAASQETKGKAQFIGITVRDNAPTQAQAFVRAQGISYPSIFDPTGRVLLPLSGEWPPSAIPTTLIIDSQGRLAVRVLAEVSEITLVDMINDVAEGK